MHISRGHSKKVETFDIDGKPNGYIIELSKNGRYTTAYLTVAYPECFKGYHEHLVREANYVCIKGIGKVVLYTRYGRREHILRTGDKLHIPRNIPTGVLNESDEECWIVNFPNPPYDPELENEQIDYTQEEVDEWLRKNCVI